MAVQRGTLSRPEGGTARSFRSSEGARRVFMPARGRSRAWIWAATAFVVADAAKNSSMNGQVFARAAGFEETGAAPAVGSPLRRAVAFAAHTRHRGGAEARRGGRRGRDRGGEGSVVYAGRQPGSSG